MDNSRRFSFEPAGSGGFMGPDIRIIVDRFTGVNYLYVANAAGCSVTPLLNRDGSPVITAFYPDDR